MKHQLSPLSCVYSPNLPELLNYIGCTLIISTYQAGKIIFISAIDTHNLIQLSFGFHRPMGGAGWGCRRQLAGGQGARGVFVDGFHAEEQVDDAVEHPNGVAGTGHPVGERGRRGREAVLLGNDVGHLIPCDQPGPSDHR